MIGKDWKKKRRDIFVEFLTKDNELVDSSIEDFVWICALVELLIEDLCMKYSGRELERILNDNYEMLEKYIAFLQSRLVVGNFGPVQ